MDYECQALVSGLLLLSLALLISVCFNFFLFIRHRTSLCREKNNCCYLHVNDSARSLQGESERFPDPSHHEQWENLQMEQVENPIYGNISADGCYEMMTMQRTRDQIQNQPSDKDLNYASLDLKKAKKGKRRPRHTKDNQQDQMMFALTPHIGSFLDMDADMDTHLPSRDNSTMVSHSSIYLNSQQIAQEAEEMQREKERERSINMEMDGCEEDSGIKGWEGDLENGRHRDMECDGVGTVHTQLSELQAVMGGLVVNEVINGFIGKQE